MKTSTLFILVLILAVVAGLLLYISSYGARVAAIRSYDDCTAAGYPVLESYPSQCKTPDGRTFVNPREQVTAPTASTSEPLNPISPTAAGGCVVGGCSGELCTDAAEGPAVSACVYKAEYGCYKQATCERQASGACGWTQTSALSQCIANARSQGGGLEQPQLY